MEILKQNALDRKIFFQNNNVVRELLTDSTIDAEHVMNSLQSLGIGAFPHYEALMLKVNLDDPNAIDRRGDIFKSDTTFSTAIMSSGERRAILTCRIR